MEKYNTIPKRLLAIIIDGILLYPISFLELFYINEGVPLFALGTLAVTAVYLFYFILLHAKYGQTVGKKITGLRVLDISESRLVNFKKSVIRESPFILINSGIILYVIIFLNADPSKAKEVIYDMTLIVNLIWVGVELIYSLSNKKRRAIHDLISDAIVIKA